MSEFKKGDKVRCIKHCKYSSNRNKTYQLVIGELHVVTSVSDSSLVLEGLIRYYSKESFELAEKTFKLQTELTLNQLKVLQDALLYAEGIGNTLSEECYAIRKANTRKTVTIGGKTYYEDELATALASIKAVQSE